MATPYIVDEFAGWDDIQGVEFSFDLQPHQRDALFGLDVIAAPDSPLPRHRRGNVKHGRKARRSR